MSLLVLDRHRDALVSLREAATALGPVLEAREGSAALRHLERDGSVRFIVAERELLLDGDTAWLDELTTRREWRDITVLLTASDFSWRTFERADGLLRRPFRLTCLPMALASAYRARMAHRQYLLYLSTSGSWTSDRWTVLTARTSKDVKDLVAAHGDGIGAVVVNPETSPCSALVRYLRSREGQPVAVACLSRDPARALAYRRVGHFFVDKVEPKGLERQLRDRLLGEKNREVARGRIALAAHRPRAALRHFERALALNPFLPEAHWERLALRPDTWAEAIRHCPRHREVLHRAALADQSQRYPVTPLEASTSGLTTEHSG